MRLLIRVVGLAGYAAAVLVADRLVRRSSRERRLRRLYREYEDAAADPAYQAELDRYEEINRAFDVAVGDGLEDVPTRPRSRRSPGCVPPAALSVGARCVRLRG
jgi:hypothetical protein